MPAASHVSQQTIFDRLLANPAVRNLAPLRRWTVSGRLGDLDDPDQQDDELKVRKAPIDMRCLIDQGRVRGAFAISPECLVSLGELAGFLPQAANAALYLQSSTDGYVVVDIEPDCPEEVALSLLALPGVAYSEVSMSGRGYHLLLPQPRNLRDFPAAAEKRVLRHEAGHYEILLDHWATFTARPVPESVMASAAAAPRLFGSVEELYASLAAHARPSSAASADDVALTAEMPEIPRAEDIVSDAVLSAGSRLKTPEDFGDDMSRFEFSVLAVLYRELEVQVNPYRASDGPAAYGPSEMAWLLYSAAVKVLPWRPKHGTRRNGRPYLLYRAASMVAEASAGRAA